MYLDIFWIGFVGAALALGFAGFQLWRVWKAPKGDEQVLAAVPALRSGLHAYWKRQYITLALLFAAAVGGMFGLNYAGVLDNPFIPFAFLSGGAWPILATFLGVKLAQLAAPRAVTAAGENLDKGLHCLLSTGAAVSFLLAGLGLGEVTGWFFVLRYYAGYDAVQLTRTLLTFGLGAAFSSFFLRAGGGMCFQCADLGARLVEQADPSLADAPNSPAAVARCVGAMAGANGVMSDLYDSYLLILPASIALGAAAYSDYGMIWNAMLLPLVVASIGALAALLGTVLIRADERTDQRFLLGAVRKGTYAAALLTAAVAAPAVFFLLGEWRSCLTVVAGLAAGCLVSHFAESLVRDGSRRAKNLARFADTGAATTLLGGVSTGTVSTLLPFLLLLATALFAFWVGGGTLVSPDPAQVEAGLAKGLYGVSLAAVGFVSTLGLTAATASFGPLSQSLDTFVRQTEADEGARSRVDALDALGSATAAAGRAMSAASAALAALLLLVSFLTQMDGTALISWNALAVTIGALPGAFLPLLFVALALSGVQRGGQLLYTEVRRQFKEIRGILKGKADPDYAKCVDICARHALYQAMLCAFFAVGCPLALGLLLGPQSLVGLLLGLMAVGAPLSLCLCSSGAAWDNVKRYIESGRHGGSGSEAHTAALTGDATGAVLRDAAAPTLNVLMKLCFTTAITALALLAQCGLAAPL